MSIKSILKQSWRRWILCYHLIKPSVGTFLLFTTPACLLFLTEIIPRQSFRLTYQWATEQFPLLFLTYIFIFFAYLLVYLLVNHLGWATFLVGGGSLLLSLVSYFKTIYRGDPLLLSDLPNWREALFISKSYTLNFPPQAIKALIIWLLLIVITSVFSPHLRRLNHRWWLSFSSVLAATIIYFLVYRDFTNTLTRCHIDYEFRHQAVQKVATYGFMPVFLTESLTTHITAPLNYTKHEIINLASNYQGQTSTNSACLNAPQPDIIVVMNESFVDIANYPKLSFSQPITPTFDRLQQQTEHGWLLVNTRGGGTAETEFEVLTGMSVSFHPPNSITYNQFLRRDLTALPRILQDNGYQTIAIHPNYYWFFNRDQVYPRLGFQHFYTLDDFATPIPIRGSLDPDHINEIGFVADSAVTDFIINLSQQQTDQPQFIFAVTIENHGYYDDKVFPDSDYALLDYQFLGESQLENETFALQKKRLDNYLVGLHDADNMLATLIDHYSHVDRPTIILFFGDHFPGFDNDLTWELIGDDTILAQQAPFVIWRNYPGPRKQTTANHGLVSAYHLSHLLLADSCQPLPPFFQFLQHHFSLTKGYNSQVYLTADSQVRNLANLDDTIATTRHQHWLWQYDLLFGRQYSLP